MMKKNLASSILKAGLIVGTLNIIAAFIQFYSKTEKNPIVVLNFIASGVFGNEAFTSGNKMVAFGLLFHYLIAFGFTFLFFVLYPKIKDIARNKLMKLTVQGAISAILILILCIGIPLSWLAQNYSNRDYK